MSEYLPAVPGRSWAEVERAADNARKILAPEYDETGLHVNIEAIAHDRLEGFGIVFGTSTLEQGVEGKTSWLPYPGRFEVILNGDIFDAFIACDRRARMTVAHELGHLSLHRDQIRAIGEAFNSPHPSAAAGLMRRKRAIRPYENPERQAEVFAGRFLIPTENLRWAITNLGLNTERQLAAAFQVSQGAIAVRLREVGIQLQRDSLVF